MVWAYVSANFAGDLVELMELQPQESAIRFSSTMPHHLESIRRWLNFFYHDSDPKYTASATEVDRKTYSGSLSVMDWPRQSPDYNIIGAVWDRVDREQNKCID